MVEVNQNKELVQCSIIEALSGGKGPFFRAFVSWLSSEVREGRVLPGVQLPTHRHLADELGLAVATVARAYREAERLGLVESTVGRGTFVAAQPYGGQTADSDALDLSTNVPTYRVAEPFLREALRHLADDAGLTTVCGYPAIGGDLPTRAAVTRWLQRTSAVVDFQPEDVILCSGVMNALFLVLRQLHQPGDTVLCEAATFFGIRDIARELGIELRPVKLDDHGMVPEALEEAAQRFGASSVILIPTLQNPTTITYPDSRRRAIAECCQRLDLTIIEDDIYGALVWEKHRLPALQVLAPERTFYLGGASKILMPGFRVGWIICPEAHREAIKDLIWATSIGAPHIGHRLFAHLVNTHQADTLASAVRQEVRERCQMTRERLGDWLAHTDTDISLQFWIPCHIEEARRIYRACLDGGLKLTPPDLPLLDPERLSGLRICVAAPSSQRDLAQALDILSNVLNMHQVEALRPMV